MSEMIKIPKSLYNEMKNVLDSLAIFDHPGVTLLLSNMIAFEKTGAIPEEPEEDYEMSF